MYMFGKGKIIFSFALFSVCLLNSCHRKTHVSFAVCCCFRLLYSPVFIYNFRQFIFQSLITSTLSPIRQLERLTNYFIFSWDCLCFGFGYVELIVYGIIFICYFFPASHLKPLDFWWLVSICTICSLSWSKMKWLLRSSIEY